jgi:hypothetical protein
VLDLGLRRARRLAQRANRLMHQLKQLPEFESLVETPAKRVVEGGQLQELVAQS